MPNYRVLVGNIGNVYEGDKEAEAKAIFNTYVGKSNRNEGMAGGEEVTMMKDGEIVHEHLGTITKGDL